MHCPHIIAGKRVFPGYIMLPPPSSTTCIQNDREPSAVRVSSVCLQGHPLPKEILICEVKVDRESHPWKGICHGWKQFRISRNIHAVYSRRKCQRRRQKQGLKMREFFDLDEL